MCCGRATACVAALIVLSAHAVLCAQGMPDDLLVIKAGRVITVSGEEFAPGLIVVEDGKITGVGSGIEYPRSARVIDARQETVMPGFVHPRSRHGLAPYRRTGVNGHWTASAEVYLSQMRFDDLVEAGFTSVCLVPDGTDIPGFASAYRTAGPEDQQMLLKTAYLRINPEWADDGKESLRQAFKKASDEIEKVKKAREEWEKKQKEKAEKAKADAPKQEGKEGEEKKEPQKSDGAATGDVSALPPPEQIPAASEKEDKFEPPAIDPKVQPLVDLIEKKEGVKLLVELFKASDLHHLDDVLNRYDGIVPVLYLGTSRSTDYNNIVDALGKRKATVVLFPWIHYLAETTFRYNLMKELSTAGCSVAVSPAWAADRDEYLRIRSRLADLVRAGLPREAAIRSLTLNPATAIGLGSRLGSIQKDKDADLVFLNGDPLDPHARVTRVMILGEFVWKCDAKEREPRS